MSKIRAIQAFKGRNEYLRFAIMSDCPWKGYSIIDSARNLDIDQIVRFMIFRELKEGFGIDEH